MDIAIVFGSVLRTLRKKAGLTQEQLGFEAGLERNYISMLELGQRHPSLATVFKLAPPLEVSPSQIIAIVEATNPDVQSEKQISRSSKE
ncbi:MULTISPECIES: helix-turn-helix transcriptional regulator [Enterobacterales]|uniref:helix-turn-helix domain-containing protein n=1 Tax=Enterobacterales TaxID=91347 RepID=UPI002ED7CA8E